MTDTDIILPENVLSTLNNNVNELGKYLTDLSRIIVTMQNRIEELEANRIAVTVSHAQVNQIRQMIRTCADDICNKYMIQDKKKICAAIRKDLMKRYRIKDLHDLPANAIAGAMAYIEHYSNIRLFMQLKNGPNN